MKHDRNTDATYAAPLRAGRRLRWMIAGIFIVEILLILSGNLFLVSFGQKAEDRSYRVEVKRLVDEVRKEGAAGTTVVPDPEKYPHLTSIRPYDPEENRSSGEYCVEEIDGDLYRIEYEREKEVTPLIYMNIVLGLMLVISLFLLIYIERKVVRPFASMEKLAVELAKGNLSMPVQEEKSHLFGQFLWGMDMLREQLEESRERERAYIKDRKMLMLSLSHDIKTPLSAIELYTKALSSGLYDTPEKRSEAYEGTQKNIESLKRYIDEIAAASRDDFLALEVKEGDCYIDDVIAEIADYYKDKFISLHTEFTIDDHANPLVKGDRDRLIEVLQNLLENAIKYGDGREVSI